MNSMVATIATTLYGEFYPADYLAERNNTTVELIDSWSGYIRLTAADGCVVYPVWQFTNPQHLVHVANPEIHHAWLDMKTTMPERVGDWSLAHWFHQYHNPLDTTAARYLAEHGRDECYRELAAKTLCRWNS